MPSKPIEIASNNNVLRAEAPESWTNPSNVAVQVFDTDGTDMLFRTTGKIGSTPDAGATVTIITDGTSTVEDGDIVTITDTESYNGTWVALNCDSPVSFDISATYVSDASSGTWTHEKAATIYAGATLGSAASYQANSVTLAGTPATLIEDDLIRIGSDAEGWDECRVYSYNSSTKEVELKNHRLKHSHASGVAVKGRWFTYALPTVLDDWEGVDEVSVVWINAGTKDVPFTEDREVLKRKADFQGLREHFKERFPRLSEITESNVQNK